MDSYCLELELEVPVPAKRIPGPTLRGFETAPCGTCANLDREHIKFLEGLHPGLSVVRHQTQNTVTIRSTMQELAEDANSDCPSCKLLLASCLRLGKGQFDVESEVDIELTFKEGIALIMTVYIPDTNPLILELFTTTGLL